MYSDFRKLINDEPFKRKHPHGCADLTGSVAAGVISSKFNDFICRGMVFNSLF